MDLQIEKEDLLDGINIVSKAVANNSTMPILGCVLFKATSEGVKLTATNLDLGIETALIGAGVLEGGEIALDAKLLFEIARKLPDEEVHIQVNDKNIATIKSGKSKFEIMGIEADTFPALQKVEHENRFTVKCSLLRDMIRQTIFSVGINEAKPELTGELIKIEGNLVNVVAVDGYRISHRYAEIEHQESPVKVIVPGKTMSEIVKLLPASDSDMTVYFTDKHILFELDTCTVVSRIISGEFIDYARAFSVEHKTVTKINRAEFIASLERACLVAVETGKKTPVKLDIKSDLINITSQTEIGTTHDEIAAASEGSHLNINFNPRYLIDALKAIEDREVVLHFAGKTSPCIIKPIEQGNYSYLILPLRLK